MMVHDADGCDIHPRIRDLAAQTPDPTHTGRGLSVYRFSIDRQRLIEIFDRRLSEQ
jgi:hypothetical protein